MKIKETTDGYSNYCNIGMYSYFITLDKLGVFVSLDELFELCQHYNYIIFNGDDPLNQKEEVAKLCKRLVKNNPNVKFEIHTTGVAKPAEPTGYVNNTKFIFKFDNNKKYDENIILWYVLSDSKFVFNINSIEDLDRISFLVGHYDIKKSQVFLMPLCNIDMLQQHIKQYHYNIALEVVW